MSAEGPEIMRLLLELKSKVDDLARVVGEESDDGKSGTGLVGEMRRATIELSTLKTLRDRGLGLLLGIGLVVVVLTLGAKQALTSIFELFK